nr:vegetative cell wall protein gp1-like [Aegilops tauschii subsp. strangulata]
MPGHSTAATCRRQPPSAAATSSAPPPAANRRAPRVLPRPRSPLLHRRPAQALSGPVEARQGPNPALRRPNPSASRYGRSSASPPPRCPAVPAFPIVGRSPVGSQVTVPPPSPLSSPSHPLPLTRGHAAAVFSQEPRREPLVTGNRVPDGRCSPDPASPPRLYIRRRLPHRSPAPLRPRLVPRSP